MQNIFLSYSNPLYYTYLNSKFQYVPPENSDSTKIPSLNVNAPTFTPSTVQSNGGNILNQLLPNQNTSIVPPGEVMISSGKYSGPTQPHGKSYFKDEVFIRNADSGKGTLLNIFKICKFLIILYRLMRYCNSNGS